jgi:uncharacterized protein YcbK (DUF882 family)
MNPKILEIADGIRDLIGLPLTINANGRTLCGYRPANCKIGAKNSMHKKGMAVDLHCKGMDADSMRRLVIKAINSGAFTNIGAIELDVNWLHVDCRPRVNGKVLYFKA